MFTTTQEFSALGQSQFDKAVRFSSIVLAGAERLAALQLELSRKLLADNAQAIKALSEARARRLCRGAEQPGSAVHRSGFLRGAQCLRRRAGYPE